MHRRSPSAHELDSMLCKKEEHPLRKDFTVVHDKKLYQIMEWTSVNRIEVREHVDGSVKMMGRGRSLKFKAQVNDRPWLKSAVRLSQQIGYTFTPKWIWLPKVSFGTIGAKALEHFLTIG